MLSEIGNHSLKNGVVFSPLWLNEGFTVTAFQKNRRNGLKVSCRKYIKSNFGGAFSTPLKGALRGQKLKIFYLDSWAGLS